MARCAFWRLFLLNAVFWTISDVVRGAPTSEHDTEMLTVDAWPFTLGRARRIEAADVLFTLDPQGNLVVRCAADVGSALAAGGQVNLLLLDKADRMLQAASATFAEDNNGRLAATASLGRSMALGGTARFVISGLGDGAPADGCEPRKVRVTALTADGVPRPIHEVSDESGKTRAMDVALRRKADGTLVAAVHFSSVDKMNEFELDVSVGAFDRAGRLIAAAALPGHLRVESEVVETTWKIPLRNSMRRGEIIAIAVGLGRGQTTSAPMGTLWGTFMDYAAPFTADALLAGDDPGCWTAGVKQLEQQINETLQHGLLDGLYDWERQIEERETPADVLAPYVERLRQVAAQATEPATLAAAVRLIGFSGDKRTTERTAELLKHENAEVRGSAAICLGLLGRDEGLAVLDAILGAPAPAEGDQEALRSAYRNTQLARVALATLRSDASAPVVRKWLLAYADGVAIVDNKHSPVQGSRYEMEELALLMGTLPDPRYAAILIDAIERLEARDELRGQYDASDLLSSLLVYGKQAHEFIDARVRRGDRGTLYALTHSKADAFYLPSLRAMLESSDDSDAWHWGIGYLWSIDAPEALDILRTAYDRGLPGGKVDETLRLEVAKVLAARGDNRGLAEAFAVAVELARPAETPTDEKTKKYWEDEREDRREAALDVFDRAQTDAVVEVLIEHADEQDAAVQLATLAILEELSSLPEAIRPQVEQWAYDGTSGEVAGQAIRLLTRDRSRAAR